MAASWPTRMARLRRLGIAVAAGAGIGWAG